MLFQIGKNQKKVVAHQIENMNKCKKIVLLVFGAGIFIIFSLLCMLIIRSPHTIVIEGYSETYQQTNSNSKLDLLKTHLPQSANKIVYRIFPYMQNIVINFKITQKEFLAWSKKQKWVINKIITPVYINSISIKGNELQDISLEIKNGYVFKKNIKRKDVPEMLESALTIYFDSDTNRCYYSYTLL